MILQIYYLNLYLKFKSGEIYNLSDDKPSSSKEITLYGAKMLNIENQKLKLELKVRC